LFALPGRRTLVDVPQPSPATDTGVLALAGDTMLGRGVADRLAVAPPESLFGPRLTALLRSADAVVLNLECCVSERGRPWPAPGKRYFFRAPPSAVEALRAIGTTCVTLANNHALDFGREALQDTLAYLAAAGIGCVGAGTDADGARAYRVIDVGRTRVAVLGLTDHPADFAAGPGVPGVAFADLSRGLPGWVAEAITAARQDADEVLVTPHWGPNLVARPVRHVRRAAAALLHAGAGLVAGHSAHVVQGAAGSVLFDLGDFIDDYAVHPDLRNDLGALWLVHLGAPPTVEAVPLRIGRDGTELAAGDDRTWMQHRFVAACGALGTSVRLDSAGHLRVRLSS
jgi:poly-gamma-glutamate synthesis protein (capsule biosynthesis protein)